MSGVPGATLGNSHFVLIAGIVASALLMGSGALLPHRHSRGGAAKSLLTIRRWWARGFEMTWIGLWKRDVTYVICTGLVNLAAVRR